MKQTDYLDAAKRKLRIESDYALAPHLEMTRAAVSKLRNRRLVMSNTTAGKISEITGIPIARIIVDLELERGTNDELWKRIARRVAGLLLPAVAVGAASFGVVPSPLFASNVQPGSTNAGLCIMLNRRKRLPLWLTALALLRAPS